METREWAKLVLSTDRLSEKLFCPAALTDLNPGPALIISEPGRPVHMKFQRRTREEKLPPFQELGNKDKRAVCLHRFAGHELLAIEIMAYALLAFPEAPKNLRKAIVHTLKEEQGHVQLYMQRLSELGLNFGDLPLYKHFWAHVPYLTSPIEYISVMNLTLEMANLDFAPIYGQYFEKYDDPKSAELMNQILVDEIRHVSVGYKWLCKLKDPKINSWNAFVQGQSPLLSPKRAKGFQMFEEHRRKAGIPEEWIEKIKNS